MKKFEKKVFLCPVCGYDRLAFEPYQNDGCLPSLEICPCCGFQFGYDDYPNKEEGIISWRNEWIDSGCIWFSKGEKPYDGWNPYKQILLLTNK